MLDDIDLILSFWSRLSNPSAAEVLIVTNVFFICACIDLKVCLCHSGAIGCLQVIYSKKNDAKPLVKGTNSPLKAVILPLMEMVFNRVSGKTAAETWAGTKGRFTQKGRK